MIWWARTFSKTFAKIGEILTGLYLDLFNLSDFLYTGITSAFFRIFGKVPSSNALFIMFEITGAIWKEACFSNLAEIWSHPVAFFGFSVFRILSTSSLVVWWNWKLLPSECCLISIMLGCSVISIFWFCPISLNWITIDAPGNDGIQRKLSGG